MTRRKLIEYIQHPELLKELSIEEMQQWIAEFPYSQNLRILFAQKVKAEGLEAQYPEALHNAAMYSTDREQLHNVLEGTTKAKESVESVSEDDPQVYDHTDEAIEKDKVEFLSEDLAETAQVESVSEVLGNIEAEAETEEVEEETKTAEAEPQGFFEKAIYYSKIGAASGIGFSMLTDPEAEAEEVEQLPYEEESTLEPLSADEDLPFTEDELKGGQTPSTYYEQEIDTKEEGPEDIVDESVEIEKVEVSTDIEEGEIKIEKTKEISKEKEREEDVEADNGPDHSVAMQKESGDESLSGFSQWLLAISDDERRGQHVAKKSKRKKKKSKKKKSKAIDVASGQVESSELIEDESDLISETLAQLLLAQGYKGKSIKMYKKLTLKYPEKSSYFADLIEKIQSS